MPTANPKKNDVILFDGKLAVVIGTDGKSMSVKYLDGLCQPERTEVSIGDSIWRPLTDKDKEVTHGSGATGIIEKFKPEEFEFVVKWADDTKRTCSFKVYGAFRKAAADKAKASKKRAREVDAKEKQMRDFLASKNLDKIADQLIDLGYDDLCDLQKNVDLMELDAHCKDVGIKPAHIAKLLRSLQEIRAPVAPSLCSHSVTDQPDLAAAGTPTTAASAVDKMRAWWDANGGLSIIGYDPETWATQLSGQLAAAKSVSDKFRQNLHADLIHIDDAMLKTFTDGHYLVEMKKALKARRTEITHSIAAAGPSSASVASGPPPSAGKHKPVPDYSEVDTSNYAKFVEGHPALQKFPKKFTESKEFVVPYTYQMQLILALLDTDTYAAPESSILSIGTEFRGIGKSYLMSMMGTHLQGYSLTLDPKTDFKEIAKRRLDPETWELFNERPLLYFDVSKNDKMVLGEKVDLGSYFEDLSSGAKCGGAWDPTSRPLIIFIGNDHLTLKSLGEFSGHRVDFYSIMSVGAPFPNAKGITDFQDYKLVVCETMMGKIGMMAEEQVQKGSFERDASEAGEDTDIFIFLKYFKIVPYSLGQKSTDRMKAKEVAKKLVQLSKEHFASLLSASGESFFQAKWTAWYEAKKDKLGSVQIHMWSHGNQPHLNVQLKETPVFEKN